MLSGRTNELQYLNTVYQKPDSQMIVVYGQKNVGKTTLLQEFIQDKNSFYYLSAPASTREQQFLLGKKLKQDYPELSDYPNYEEIFTALLTDTSVTEKKVLVFDEWEHLIKADVSFMNALIKLIHHAFSEHDVMIILCSSSIGFIENGMVARLGKSVLDISGFLKVKELKFSDLICHFPTYSIKECIQVFSILGGIPGLWNYFNPSLSLKENICKHILVKESFLSDEGGRFVKEELRETSVYYTLLASLAAGRHKLNQLHQHTGFSRAKISVYLKHLMELEIVEKVFSIDTPGRDSQKKGIYRISNHYVHFWFRFIYPNYSDIHCLSSKQFYNQYIKPEFDAYCEEYFSSVCREYMILSDSKDAFPFHFEKTGLFEGKAGKIDFIGQDKDFNTIVAFCYFTKPMVTYEDYQQNLHVLEQARLNPSQIYLFANGRFEEKLTLESKIKDNLTLIGMDDL